MYLDNYTLAGIIIALAGSMLAIGYSLKQNIEQQKEIYRLRIELRNERRNK